MKKVFLLPFATIALVVLSGCANGRGGDDSANAGPTPVQQAMPMASDEAMPMENSTDVAQDVVITTDVAPIDQVDSPDTLLKDIDTMMDGLDAL